MIDWQKRAEAAEAKLAEYEKQKPDFHVRQIRTAIGPAWVECGADYHRGKHFFTRPAPAVSLPEQAGVRQEDTQVAPCNHNWACHRDSEMVCLNCGVRK